MNLLLCNYLEEQVEKLLFLLTPPRKDSITSHVLDVHSVADVGPPCGSQKDCKNVADGKFADTDNQCTSYYTCSGGTYFGHNYCSGSESLMCACVCVYTCIFSYM